MNVPAPIRYDKTRFFPGVLSTYMRELSEARTSFEYCGYVGHPLPSGLYIVYAGSPSSTIAVRDPVHGWICYRAITFAPYFAQLYVAEKRAVHIASMNEITSIITAGSADAFIAQRVADRLRNEVQP